MDDQGACLPKLGGPACVHVCQLGDDQRMHAVHLGVKRRVVLGHLLDRDGLAYSRDRIDGTLAGQLCRFKPCRCKLPLRQRFMIVSLKKFPCG